MSRLYTRLQKTVAYFTFCIALSAWSGFSLSDDSVLATVNGDPITEAFVTQLMEELQGQFEGVPESDQKAAALSSAIEIKMLSQRAKTEVFTDNSTYKQKLQLMEERLLHEMYISEKVSEAVTDDALQARYDTIVGDKSPETEVHARHILVGTREEAQAIIKLLDEGGDFVELAKEKSIGPSSGNGGDLGYFTAGRMVPEFEVAAFELEAGTYTGSPVVTQFGFHVIKSEDKRQTSIPTFDEIEPQLRQLALSQTYGRLIAETRENSTIEFADKALESSVKQFEN